MIIKKATKRDIKEVKSIVDTLQVSRQQKDWENAKCGFFEYQKSEEDLLKALNPYFIVSENNKGTNGYCLSYDNGFLRENYKSSENLEFRFILDNIRGRFLYIDQLGVLNPNSLVGGITAVALMNETLNLTRKNGLEKVIAYICEKPLKNIKSINFANKYGFNKINDVKIENQIVLGFYKLVL